MFLFCIDVIVSLMALQVADGNAATIRTSVQMSELIRYMFNTATTCSVKITLSSD